MAFVRGANVVTEGLVLALDAANPKSYVSGSLDWRDLSGTNVTGSLVNGPTFNNGNGGSIQFDGVDDFINNTFANPYSETIIVWAKSLTSTWNQNGWISSARRENGHIIHPEQGFKTIAYYILNSSSTFTLVGVIGVDNITIPHMYTISTNGSNSHKCYFDNIVVNESTTSISRTITPIPQTWYLGRDDVGSRYGNGNIYSVLRYNRQLSNSEVLQNYNATKARFGIE
jgi:hypothetical protein